MNVLVNDESLRDIAGAIRSKLDTQATYKPGQMASAIASIPTGYPEPAGTIPITTNGTHNVKDYASAAVNVSNTYTAEDETKVVQNGALVAQENLSRILSGHFNIDTTTIKRLSGWTTNNYTQSDAGKIVVAVPDSTLYMLVTQYPRSADITQNGTYDTTRNNEVTVNVSLDSLGVHKGSAAPTADIGSDEDLYIQETEFPDDVTYLTGLSNTTTEYINTGITANNGTRLYVEFSVASSETNYIAGARRNTSGFYIETGNTNCPLYLGFGSSRSTGRSNSYAPDVMTVADVGQYYRKYTTMSDPPISERFNDVQSGFTTPETLRLFGVYNNSAPYMRVGTSVTIYRATIRQNGVVVADFVPALDTNDTPCMYEAVSGTFFHNDGTGDFVSAGSAASAPIPAQTVYRKIRGAWTIIEQNR